MKFLDSYNKFSWPVHINKGFNNLALGGLGKPFKGMYIVQFKVNGVVNDSQEIIKNYGD